MWDIFQKVNSYELKCYSMNSNMIKKSMKTTLPVRLFEVVNITGQEVMPGFCWKLGQVSNEVNTRWLTNMTILLEWLRAVNADCDRWVLKKVHTS